MRWGSLAVWVAVLGGCKPQLADGFDAAAAAAFQEESDRSLQTPTSPMTAVEAFYFEQSELGLGVEAGQVARTEDPAIVLSGAGDTVRCTRGCGPSPVDFESTTPVPLDPFVLMVGRQAGSGGRVVVHDPRRVPNASDLADRWFDVAPSLIVAARFEPVADGEVVELSTTRGLNKPMRRAGVLRFELSGQEQTLVAFASVGHPDAPLLVPFTDPTNGESSYPVGRYLDVDAADRGVVGLDFNRATNPWCAYSPHYNCPVPPPENRLQAPIEAGERQWGPHSSAD
jgi:hypothetical protein